MPLVNTREFNLAKEIVDQCIIKSIDDWSFVESRFVTSFTSAYFKDGQKGCKPEKQFQLPPFLDYADFKESYEKVMSEFIKFFENLDTCTEDTFPTLLANQITKTFTDLRNLWDKYDETLENAEIYFTASLERKKYTWSNFKSMYFSFIMAVIKHAFTKQEFSKQWIYLENSYPNKLKIILKEPKPPQVDQEKIKCFYENSDTHNEVLNLMEASLKKVKVSSIEEEDLKEDHQLLLKFYKKIKEKVNDGSLTKKGSQDQMLLIQQIQSNLIESLTKDEKDKTDYFAYMESINRLTEKTIKEAPEGSEKDSSDGDIEEGPAFNVESDKLTVLDNEEKGTNQFLVKLPFSSAPKVKSSIQLKKGVTPPKWTPGKISLWEHLKSVMEYCLSLGIVDFSEKLKTCFYIFRDERDRQEFSEKFLKNLKSGISEAQFTSEIHRMIKIFDRQNSVDPESYREKLSSSEAFQKPNERIRSYMNRLTEYYMISFPDSYKAKSIQKELCKKFIHGLIDREIAQEVSTTKEGYNAIYVSGDKHKILTLIEELSFRSSSVYKNEQNLAVKFKELKF